MNQFDELHRVEVWPSSFWRHSRSESKLPWHLEKENIVGENSESKSTDLFAAKESTEVTFSF